METYQNPIMHMFGITYSPNTKGSQTTFSNLPNALESRFHERSAHLRNAMSYGTIPELNILLSYVQDVSNLCIYCMHDFIVQKVKSPT